MMARWVDLEDKENDRFLKRNNDEQGNGKNHYDKGQQNNSGNPRKRKPDQEFKTVVHHPRERSRGATKYNLRKSCTNNARCICSSSVSALASHPMLHPFLKTESERIMTTTMRVTSWGIKIFKTRRMSSTSF
jgi:hypothetical protein